MEQQEYDDLLRRLTALVVKLDERDDALVESQEQLVQRQEQHEATLARLDAGIDELKALHREQVAINQRLETLLERAWRHRTNGHTD